MGRFRFWKKPSVKELLPSPIQASHFEYSMIASLHDDPVGPDPDLIALSLEASRAAAGIDLKKSLEKRSSVPSYVHLWPGEHYRLLAGLVQVLRPKVVIEIGTSTGLSALCMKPFLPAGGKIETFDIVPWNSYPNTVFEKADFDGSSG